ncbi:MAG: ABC transporter ATP-binding protein [Flavobacteriales bacterium]
MTPIELRIEELVALTSGNDVSLATRRVMDICDDHPELHDLRAEAMRLRADYNMSRELGAAELGGEQGAAFAERARAIAGIIQQRAAGIADHAGNGVRHVVFQCAQLTKSFSAGGHRFQLGPFDLELRTGEITGVVGENGNGKTTLLRQIAGLLDQTSGAKAYPGAGEDPYAIRQTIAWIPQRSTRWHGTLMQNLRFIAAVHGITGQDNTDRVNYTLHRLGLTRFQDLTWKQLSSGYKLRFELAKMVVWRPRILVLDEPIANLDLQAQQLFLQDLKHLVASPINPITVILSSQQLHEIEAIADNIIFLKNGKPVFSGAAASFDHDRNTNVFEIKLQSPDGSWGTFAPAQLEQALGHGNFHHIDDTGLILRLTTPRHITAREVLKAISQADLEVSYFRDISTSTRKLFHQDT